MSFDDFPTFIDELFPRLYQYGKGKLRVYEDRFQVIRVFALGVLEQLVSDKYG